MIFDGFRQMLLKFLRVPPGTSIRNASATGDYDIMQNEYIATIIDITIDDICIGKNPLSYDCDPKTPQAVLDSCDQSCEAWNKIIKWVTKDLLISGVSAFIPEIHNRSELHLYPYLKPFELYLDKNDKLVAYEEGLQEKVNVPDLIIFCNYDKTSLEDLEDTGIQDASLRYRITPIPMQLKNAKIVAKNLTLAENALMRYRVALSRVLRWVNVDVGLSQGADTDTTTESVNSALNADSISLLSTDDTLDFSDTIPILPNRKGIGKPELTTDIPQYELDKLGDLDYLVKKLALCMRFPATYMDFNQTLDSNVATTLKGDIRYSRMCTAVRTLMEDTINKLYADSKQFSEFNVNFHMAVYPDSASVDLIELLGSMLEATQGFEGFIFGENAGNDVSAMRHRLDLLHTLMKSSCSSPEIQEWFDNMSERIDEVEEQQKENPQPEQGGDDMGPDMGGMDLGGPAGMGGAPGPDMGPGPADMGGAPGPDMGAPALSAPAGGGFSPADVSVEV